MKVVPRKLCKYTLPKGLTAAPRGRKEAQESPERLSGGPPPESGPQVQAIQRFPKGAVATGKATLGIATRLWQFETLSTIVSRRERPLWVLRLLPVAIDDNPLETAVATGKAILGIATLQQYAPPTDSRRRRRDGKGHSGYCDFLDTGCPPDRHGRDGKGHSGYCDFCQVRHRDPSLHTFVATGKATLGIATKDSLPTPDKALRRRDRKGHSGYCDFCDFPRLAISIVPPIAVATGKATLGIATFSGK